MLLAPVVVSGQGAGTHRGVVPPAGDGGQRPLAHSHMPPRTGQGEVPGAGPQKEVIGAVGVEQGVSGRRGGPQGGRVEDPGRRPAAVQPGRRQQEVAVEMKADIVGQVGLPADCILPGIGQADRDALFHQQRPDRDLSVGQIPAAGRTGVIRDRPHRTPGGVQPVAGLGAAAPAADSRVVGDELQFLRPTRARSRPRGQNDRHPQKNQERFPHPNPFSSRPICGPIHPPMSISEGDRESPVQNST